MGKRRRSREKNLANDENSIKNSKNHSDSIKKGMGNKYYGDKVDRSRCNVTTVKDLAIMLETIKEIRKQEQNITIKCNMHMLKILILMMCYSWSTLSQTLRKPTCGTWIQDVVTT